MTTINKKAMHDAFTAYAKATASHAAKEKAFKNAKERTDATIATLRELGVTPADIKAPDNAGKDAGKYYAQLETAIVATLTTAQQAAFATPANDPAATDRDKKARRDARKVVSSRIRRLRDALADKTEKSEADKVKDQALSLFRFAYKHTDELSSSIPNFGKVYAALEALNKTLGNKLPDDK